MATDDTEYLPLRRVRARFGVCARTIYRWEADPRVGFPNPIRIHNNRYWRLEDLVRWERARAAGKRPRHAQEVAENATA
jgi:predicted DNA-binding transcriptional regulator AlpA